MLIKEVNEIESSIEILHKSVNNKQNKINRKQANEKNNSV